MPALTVQYGNKTIPLEEGESLSLKCKGFPFATNFYVTCHAVGYFTYGNITYVGQQGSKIGLACANKIMGSNITVYARNPFADSPLPIPVDSAAKMDEILNRSNLNDVGSVYKYIGEPTSSYEKGSLYIIERETEL